MGNDIERTEKEEIKDRIRELLIAEYEAVKAAAERIAPDFDYEAEAAKLQEEEAAAELQDENSAEHFVWKEDADRAAEEEARRREHEERLAALMAKPLPPAIVSKSKYRKPPYEPKTGFGRLFLRDRHSRTLLAALLLLAVFIGYKAYDFLVPKAVNITYVSFAGTQEFEYRTTARTVGALMDELAGMSEDNDSGDETGGPVIAADDPADHDAGSAISAGMELEIRHAVTATARIGGSKQEIRIVPGTVEENLAFNGVTYDGDDEISPALDSEVSEDTRIRVDEVHYVIEDKTEIVEAVDRVILDPSLTSGVQEQTEGNDGEGIFTYTTRYVNGKDEGTERELSEWITEPHDNVLRLGTSATGNSGEYIVTRTFTANTTAYTARPGARGALGMVVHVGTCAVDPSFVSLRSELWVEDYGYAYAMDTGSAVKGNVVDLYMTSTGQCIQWGRRNKTAYVLQPVD